MGICAMFPIAEANLFKGKEYEAGLMTGCRCWDYGRLRVRPPV